MTCGEQSSTTPGPSPKGQEGTSVEKVDWERDRERRGGDRETHHTTP